LAAERLASVDNRILTLREQLYSRLTELLPGVELNGHPTERLPNTLNISFKGIAGADLLERIPEIAASIGAACHDGKSVLSGVLAAMGLSSERNIGAVRFSLGKETTEDEVARVAELVAVQVEQLRRSKL
jgi:cysteine desulfurase